MSLKASRPSEDMGRFKGRAPPITAPAATPAVPTSGLSIDRVGRTGRTCRTRVTMKVAAVAIS